MNRSMKAEQWFVLTAMGALYALQLSLVHREREHRRALAMARQEGHQDGRRYESAYRDWVEQERVTNAKAPEAPLSDAELAALDRLDPSPRAEDDVSSS